MKFPFPFLRKKKKPENLAVIDLKTLKEIEERNKAIKEKPFQYGNSAPGPASDFEFLGALASAATASESQIAKTEIDPEKLERIHRRIDHIIQRIELMERKIERLERRVDIKY